MRSMPSGQKGGMLFGQRVEHKKAETQSSPGLHGSRGSDWLEGRCECGGKVRGLGGLEKGL